MFGKVRSGRSGLVGPSRALSKCWILWCINAADLLLIFTDKCMCPTGGYCEEDICGQNYQVQAGAQPPPF
ncbi:hypothetical protein GQ600_17536 [Phytophthora cactorum]|nr:hypothetical protein GQ600_17536 [Phytophthora cactorum]